MISTLEILLETLRNGKLLEHTSDNVELKEDWAEKSGPKLSSLANKTSLPIAWLVVGVTDTGTLTGRDSGWAKKWEEVLSQQINAKLDPVQACAAITTHEVDGSWVVVAQLRNPGDVVYWGDDAYMASGTTTKAMAPDEILQLRIKLPGLSDYTAQEVTSDYDSALTSSFAKRVAASGHPLEVDGHTPEVLRKLGIHGRQTARVMFGSGSFRVVRYDTNREPVFNDRYLGLYRLLTPEFQGEIQLWSQGMLGTPEVPYPPKALRETLANAVAHAAYFENDGDIILELHPDHLVISNLCVRASVYFANRWFSRSHKTINSLLMESLRIAGLVDELGRGKHLIFSESMRSGKRPPEVVIEGAGRYDRWKLTLYGGTQENILLRLLERTKTVYKDEQKALIANALVLWRDKPVSEIRNYIDGDFSRQFADVLSSADGPIWYYKEKDKILLTRWARVLLGEGQDSKGLSPDEERNLRTFAYDIQTRYHSGIISPADVRNLAQMGHTASEKSLSCKLLSKWERDGIVRRMARGKYKFMPKGSKSQATYQELLKLFEG